VITSNAPHQDFLSETLASEAIGVLELKFNAGLIFSTYICASNKNFTLVFLRTCSAERPLCICEEQACSLFSKEFVKVLQDVRCCTKRFTQIKMPPFLTFQTILTKTATTCYNMSVGKRK